MQMVFSHVYEYESRTEKTTSNEVKNNNYSSSIEKSAGKDKNAAGYIDTELAHYVATNRTVISLIDHSRSRSSNCFSLPGKM